MYSYIIVSEGMSSRRKWTVGGPSSKVGIQNLSFMLPSVGLGVPSPYMAIPVTQAPAPCEKTQGAGHPKSKFIGLLERVGYLRGIPNLIYRIVIKSGHPPRPGRLVAIHKSCILAIVILGATAIQPGSRSQGCARHKRSRRRRLIDEHPKHSNLSDCLGELLEVNRFLHVSAHP